jgi:cytidylate kinase
MVIHDTLFVIAVDGPSASGKGTLARALATHYGLRHLDTGKLYRAVGQAVLLAGGNPQVEADALAAARALDEDLFFHPSLRSEATGRAASQVAALPAVRAALLDYQRAFAATPPGAVLDGRDIGTVICPDADVKLFVTADVAVRARRREGELIACHLPRPYAEILADLKERDARDAGRDIAPLKAAPDAIMLDTSAMDAAHAVTAAIQAVEKRRQQRRSSES